MASQIKQEEGQPIITEKDEKTDPKLIEQAMLWHQRMGHANYHAVKMMPQHSTGMGVNFTDLNVADMPACETCSQVGMDPFAKDGC